MPAHTPARMFFVADTFDLDTWYRHSSDAGIIFDRFRLMDYMPDKGEFQDEVYTYLVKFGPMKQYNEFPAYKLITE